MMPRKTSSDEDSTDEFKPVSPRRCQELLESQSIGRVAWQAADGPQILPVTYAYHDGTIIFRTSPYGVLSELVRPTDVALEIDELDQESRQGSGAHVDRAARRGSRAGRFIQHVVPADGVAPWASAAKIVVSRSSPRITGRIGQRGAA